ncbi:MAG: hypothetical protein ABUT20_48510 [Bacteroidota bacterium]
MEPTQSAAPVPETNSSTVNMSSSRLSHIPFVIGVLLFLAPFIDIRCNNVSLQDVNGISMATGFEIKTNNNSLLDHLGSDDSKISINKSGKRDGNMYALIALIAGIAGLVISLLKFKEKNLLGIISGIAAGGALIGLMIDIRSQLKLDLSARSDSLNISFGVEFTPWFYLAVIAFLIGAFLSYKGMSASK